MSCIYISLSKPSHTVEKFLEELKIPKERVFIVDCVTGKVVNSPKTRNILYVSRPYNLTDIGVSIARFAKNVGKNGFVLVDTLDILQMYNRPELVMQFVHSLTVLPTKYNLKLIALATVEMYRGAVSGFRQYFDKVAEVTPVEFSKGKPIPIKGH
jgi:hypothetical protein